MPRTLNLLAVVAVLLCAAPEGHATNCNATAGLLSFGVYDTLISAATDSTGSLTIVCTPAVGDPLTTTYTITLAGTGTGGDSVRSISFSTHRLHYQLYKDAARLQVWGNGGSSGLGVTSSVTSSGPLVSAVQVHTVYARLPGQQIVPAGTYAGSLLVTIDY